MYCPNCASRVLSNQKYCRTCGMGLQAIAQLVTQQQTENPNLLKTELATSSIPSPHHSDLAAQAARLIFAGVCVFLCGLILFVVARSLDIDRIIFLPATITVCLGTLLMLYATLLPRLRASKMISPSQQPVDLPAADTTTKLALASELESAISIVEHTTRQLEPIKAQSGDLL